MSHQAFSTELEKWLKSKGDKTLGGLEDVFGQKSFAIAFLLLMFLPALPIPTGGITHFVLQPITMLVAIEMIVGRRTIWLPKAAKQRHIGSLLEGKALPFIMKRIRWFERWSRPRLGSLLDHQAFRSLVGLLVLSLTIAAFLAPPFSGLDTLPSMGVVIIALALILEDIVMFIVGMLVGAIGVGLIIGLGAAAGELLQRVF